MQQAQSGSGNKKQKPSQQTQGASSKDKQQTSTQNQNQQSVPLSPKQQQASQVMEQQIQNFEKQLEVKSNDELKTLATNLETVERNVLLEKIDKELNTVKETLIKPGDGVSVAAAAGATAATITATEPAPPT
jgi:hypothetical protein